MSVEAGAFLRRNIGDEGLGGLSVAAASRLVFGCGR